VLNDATLAAAVVWLFALILASLTVRHWAGPWVHAHPILAVAGAAAIARAVPTLVLDRGLPFDIEAHWWIGSLALAGRDVYIDPLAANRYPYPPILHEYLSASLVWRPRAFPGLRQAGAGALRSGHRPRRTRYRLPAGPHSG